MAPTLPAVTVLQPGTNLAGPQAVFALEASAPPSVQRTGVVPAGELAALRDGVRVCTAGEVLALLTFGGGLTLSLEDETGIAVILLSPELARSKRCLLSSGAELLVAGRLHHRGGTVRVRAERIDAFSALADPPSYCPVWKRSAASAAR